MTSDAGVLRRPPQPWSVGDAIGHAFVALRKSSGALFLPLFVLLAIASATDTAIGFAARTLVAHKALKLVPAISLAVGAGIVIQAVIATLASAGLHRTWIAAARGEALATDEAFKWLTPRAVFRLAWAGFLLFLVALLPTAGVVFMGFCLTPHFIVDRDMSVSSAMRESWRATRGSKGALLVLGLCVLPIHMVGLVAGGIGLCASSAMIGVAFAYVYTRASGTNELPAFTPEFATRSMRVMLRTTLAVSAAAFFASIYAVHLLPPVRGSAWNPSTRPRAS